MGKVNAAHGAGFIVGPAIGGILGVASSIVSIATVPGPLIGGFFLRL